MYSIAQFLPYLVFVRPLVSNHHWNSVIGLYSLRIFNSFDMTVYGLRGRATADGPVRREKGDGSQDFKEKSFRHVTLLK